MRRRALPGRWQLGDLGQELFRALFSGEAGQLLATSLALATERGTHLRLIWHPDDTAVLATLPVELLRDPATNRRFALDPRTPVVRVLPAAAPPRPVAIESPVRFLLVAASPWGSQPINVEAELKAITCALDLQVRKGLATIETCVGVTLPKLSRLLRDDSFHILHFLGHGVFLDDGYLVLEADRANSEVVERERLEVLLGPLGSMRLVVFNCCSSAQASRTAPRSGLAQAISRLNVPAVVGMQTPISDTAAVCFSEGFYGALASGSNVDVATNSGRQAMHLANHKSEKWAAPVIFLRNPLDATHFSLPRVPPPLPSTKLGRWMVDRLLDHPARVARWLALAFPGVALLWGLTALWFSGVFVYRLFEPRDVLRREAWLLGMSSIVIAPLALDLWRGATSRLWHRCSPLCATAVTLAGVGLFVILWLGFVTS
ncbi:MAG: CHAT domain-containing protein [Thermoanaerobaculia bacterium]|nr:CHAT domain-containing protein [Thermoanaerobaculia bacterium]